jgi:hypothetical protein
MGKISIHVDNKPVFSWEGDEAAVTEVLETIPVMADRCGMSPGELADHCMHQLLTDRKLEADSEDAQELHMLGIVWSILQLDSENADHPGKIADYAGAVDFAINLIPRGDTGYQVHIEGEPKFNA